MENNEIMTTEEIMENSVELVQEEGFKVSKGLIITAAVGATVLGGILVYKKLVKPAIAKIKAKKEQSDGWSTYAQANGCDVDSEDND